MNLVVSACVLAAAIALPGPSRAQDTAKATLDAKSEAALRERVMRWWQAREKREHQTMYDLHEPAYRSKVSFVEFMPESTVRSRFDISSPAVKEITVETQDRVKVVVEFRGMVPILGESVPSRSEESWIKVDGEWYRVHQETPKTILPTPATPAATPAATPPPPKQP